MLYLCSLCSQYFHLHLINFKVNSGRWLNDYLVKVVIFCSILLEFYESTSNKFLVELIVKNINLKLEK
jgi:hypothetical protein